MPQDIVLVVTGTCPELENVDKEDKCDRKGMWALHDA